MRQRKDSRLRLAIFTSDDKKLCYIYTNIGQKSFHCIECKHKKIYVSASVCQENPDGSEYIRLGNTKHICKPIKFSNVENEGIKLLKNSGLETKVIKVDKSKIVEETDFELRLSKAGVPNGRMIIIDSKDRTKCYEYFYRKAANRYFCCKCVTVSAVVVKENDKTFIRLGQKDHTCQPVKYEPKKPIIRKPDFKIFNLTDTRRVQRLVIFTIKAQSHCYKYIYDSHNSKYFCSECYSKESKRVTAKLLKDSEGIEYVLQSKMDHICEPLTFNKKDFDD
uniref:Uncharacterized protein n=1 Tax=Panagrolaimus davidi TaxID=227884 RepID=A0A914Q8H5_9BILA